MPDAFYSFLPYLRQGFSAYIKNEEGGTAPSGLRPKVDLKLTVSKTSASGGNVQSQDLIHDFLLRAPVDVKGINKNAIVKVSPGNWTTNFEPNYLPYIEFYDEDFCWRYTPAKAKISTVDLGALKLRPWITLVVLKEDEFTNDTFNGILPSITLAKPPKQVFPDQDDLWAYAHVHLNENAGADENRIDSANPTVLNNVLKKVKDILNTTPDKGICRLISPRRLEPNTNYHAFLIPTFEAGRLTGLGIDAGNTGMLQGAWDAGTPVGLQFPVYHSWFFKTGAAGDFESLARLLQPRILDHTVGQRAIDLQKSNNPLLEAAPLPDNGNQTTVKMQGALQPVDTIAEDWDCSEPYSEAIRDIINAPSEILLNTPASADPLIAPPIYGRWHAAEDTVDPVLNATQSINWLQEVNLDPRMRVMAGAGAEVIRRNQEEYMEAAWKQVGEVREANNKLRLMQLSRMNNKTLYDKHLVPLNDELLINVAAPIHARIINQPLQQTVYADIKDSVLPVTMFTGAFRRLTRDNGIIARGILLETGSLITTTELIADINNGTAVIYSTYTAPSGMITSSVVQQLLSTSLNSIAPNAGFIPSAPGVSMGSASPGVISGSTANFVATVSNTTQFINQFPQSNFTVNPAISITATSNIILTRTEPYNNALNLARATVQLRDVRGDEVIFNNLNQVMAHPRIKKPMYQELAKLSPDWLMPGLNSVSMNSVNLLTHNQKYIEAFMLGLNYEMNRELLWRGYPTDQRATVFSYFWGYNSSMASVDQIAVSNAPANVKSGIYDLSPYRDIEDIHEWTTQGALSALGSNSGRALSGNLSVLVIRGELLRKFPGTVIYLQKSEWQKDSNNNPIFTQPRKEEASTPVYPVFTGKLEPDVYLLGFDKEASLIKGGIEDPNNPGYFVVFQERVGEVRFGADEYDSTGNYTTSIQNWNEVNWSHLKDDPTADGFIQLDKDIDIVSAVNDPDQVVWHNNSATVAYALLQLPVKLSVHGHGLIP